MIPLGYFCLSDLDSIHICKHYLANSWLRNTQVRNLFYICVVSVVRRSTCAAEHFPFTLCPLLRQTQTYTSKSGSGPNKSITSPRPAFTPALALTPFLLQPVFSNDTRPGFGASVSDGLARTHLQFSYLCVVSWSPLVVSPRALGYRGGWG